MSKIAQRIKELRNENNLTQQEFGKIFGIGKSTVSMYENGNSTPDDDLKSKMADHFNVTVDYLLGRTNQRQYNTKHRAFHTTSLEGLDENDIALVENLINSLKEKHKK